jgi:tetratricopeptide (TPR) repeat protein
MRRNGLWSALVALAAGCALDHPPTPVEQGMSLMRSGSYPEAIDSFSEAIRLNPRDAQAYLFRGRAYQCRNQPGDLDTAIDDFASAIRFNPQDSEAYYSLAIAYRDRGVATKSKADGDKARFYDEKARRLDSQLGPEVEGLAESDLPPPPVLPFATTSTTTDDAELTEAQPDKPIDSKEANASETPESADDALRRAESKAAEIENDLDITTRRRGSSATGSARTRPAPSKEAGAAATGAARASRRAERYQQTNPPQDEPELTRPRAADALPPMIEQPDGIRPITEYDVPRKTDVGGRASRYSSRSPYGAGAAEPSPQVPGTESAIVPQAPRNRSPFPQRQPNPTGFNRMQGVEGTGRQPRPYYTTPDRFRDELR